MRSTPPLPGSRWLTAGLVAGLLASPLGCESTPPVVPTVPTASVAVTPPPPPTAPVDLAPVAEPADIVLVARWKNPSATFTGLSACSAVPSPLITNGVKHLVDRALASAFRGGVDGRQLAEIIALDAPVDLLASLDTGKRGQPGAFFAFSIPLVSLERAKGVLDGAGPLSEVEPGFYRVGTKDEGDLTCVVAAAAGTAPARLVCGPRDRDISALAPYLTRNLPVAAPPAQDVHAELRLAPVDARYGADLRRYIGLLPALARSQSIDEPRFDRALGDAADALAVEGPALLSDLDRLTVDLGVDDASCLTAKTSLDLRGKSSWVAGTLADRGSRSGPPPAIFWRAPVDSDSASYGHGSDVSRYDGIFRTLRGFLEGKLAKEQIGSDADRKALASLIASPVGKDTSFVLASGHSHSKPPAAAVPGAKPGQDELVSAYLGWYVLGFDEGAASLGKLLKDLVAVYGRKGLMDPLRKQIPNPEKLPVVKLVPAPAQLGRGALDVEIALDLARHSDDEKGAKKKAGGLKIHVLLMAEGKTTWLAVGADRDELVKRLLGVKAGAPDAGTLASRPGLEPLRATDAFSNGFLTLGLLTRGVADVLGNPAVVAQAGSKSALLTEITTTLSHLPHNGGTPIFVTSTMTGAGARSELSLRMPKGSFEDLGVIVNMALRLANIPGLHP
jgi:hypothetical protein